MKNFAGKLLPVLAMLLMAHNLFAQDNLIRGRIFSDGDGEGVAGVNITELDPTNRVVSGTITDMDGNFSLKIKSIGDKLKFSFIGFEAKTLPIGAQKVFNIRLKEKSTTFADFVVTGKKMSSNGTFDIPTREISGAIQKVNAKDFEDLSIISIDEALQGRVAGLDIVSASGDVGSGTSMRIRGITSINSGSEPLIVLNGIIYDAPSASSFDFATANQEQFADLLSVNVADIESITVLKDAASTAQWGSRGANGVISIQTKKGEKGNTKVMYSYKYSGAVQPKGMTMLTGDDYTMMLKEAYFNPTMSDNDSNIREFNYDKTNPDYENYNNNTDWVSAVTQYGITNDHNVQLSGGGDRARFLVSGGYYDQTGTVIGQHFIRYSSRVSLDYFVSDRIKFSTEFSFTEKNNKENYGGLLNTAYKIMPNMSIYSQNADGTNTDRFFKMPQNNSDNTLSAQRGLTNPVALGTLATKNVHDVRIIPIFRLQYDFTDPAKQLLRFKSVVSFDVKNASTYSYLPKELVSSDWSSGSINKASTNDNKYLYISTDENLSWSPKFENSDHSFLLYGSFQLGTSTSRYQSIETSGAPNGITASTASGYVSSFGTGPSESRWMAFLGMAHYVFKDRYVADFTLRRGGSTKFGDNRKWGYFPGISFAWNIADEPFLEGSRKWLSTLKFRPSWGFAGNEPNSEYLFYSMYSAYSNYLDIPTIRPDNIQLTNLRWEKVTSWNWGLDLGLFDDIFTADFNYYFKHTADMLFGSITIPTSSGYGNLSYQNAGTMDNNGWELNLQGNKLLKIGDFYAGIMLNFSNYINTIIDLKQSILDSYNKDFDYQPGSYLTRLQVNNAYGSIYGFRYKGVYQYGEYEPGREGKSPFALDADGQIIRDANGEPLRMTFAAGKTSEYKFKGGDAIYEDINHDGNINELDIVYLGNSNPLFNGGVQLKFNYKRFSATVFSNYRIGNKVVNGARMNAENMYSNNNQAASVNWRWRKDGDVTSIPRAMIGTGYNHLGSDRFVEDASFVRIKNIQLNYSFDPKLIKQMNLTQLSLYMSINNPVVFTKYSGVDPEVNYGSLGVSTDNSQTPVSKYFTLGVTIIL